MGKKQQAFLIGTSAILSATSFGLARLKRNIKTNYLPKDDEKPFMNSEFFECRVYRIHYRIDNSKQEMIKGKIFMIHGFGLSTICFDEMVEYLTKSGYMCVRADAPNFGYSTRENGNIKYIPKEDLFFEIMDKISPNEKWILAGHSMGGGIAINMILQCPQYFNALVLFAPRIAYSAPQIIRDLVISKPFTEILNIIVKYGGGCNPFIKLVLTAATLDKKYMDNFNINLATDPLRMDKQGTALCYMINNNKQIKNPELNKIKAPIYLVWGDRDIFIKKKDAQKIDAELPNPEIYVLSGGGHSMIQNRAKKVADGVLQFIEKYNV